MFRSGSTAALAASAFSAGSKYADELFDSFYLPSSADDAYLGGELQSFATPVPSASSSLLSSSFEALDHLTHPFAPSDYRVPSAAPSPSLAHAHASDFDDVSTPSSSAAATPSDPTSSPSGTSYDYYDLPHHHHHHHQHQQHSFHVEPQQLFYPTSAPAPAPASEGYFPHHPMAASHFQEQQQQQHALPTHGVSPFLPAHPQQHQPCAVSSSSSSSSSSASSPAVVPAKLEVFEQTPAPLHLESFTPLHQQHSEDEEFDEEDEYEEDEGLSTSFIDHKPKKGGARKSSKGKDGLLPPPSPRTLNDPELLQNYRQERNRLAAKRSRERKKDYIRQLESTCRALKSHNDELSKELIKMKKDLHELRLSSKAAPAGVHKATTASPAPKKA